LPRRLARKLPVQRLLYSDNPCEPDHIKHFVKMFRGRLNGSRGQHYIMRPILYECMRYGIAIYYDQSDLKRSIASIFIVCNM